MEPGLGLLELRAILVILQTHKHLPLLDLVALLDSDPRDLADHFRRNLDFVRRHDVSGSVEHDTLIRSTRCAGGFDALHFDLYSGVGAFGDEARKPQGNEQPNPTDDPPRGPFRGSAGAAAATADLKLGKTGDLAAQLSNGEWLASISGTDQEKGQLLNCVGCHRVERIMRSKYDADGFLTQILPRMQGYVQQSMPIHPQLRPAERLMEEQGEDRIEVYRSVAQYLSTINLSTTDQ